MAFAVSSDFFKTRKLRFFEGLLSFYCGTGDLPTAMTFLNERLGSAPEGVAAGRIGRAIKEGQTFTQAISTYYPGLTPFESGLLQVGEQSGNLEVAFRSIVDEILLERKMKLDLVSRLSYPVIVLHLAGLVFTIVWSIFNTESSSLLGFFGYFGLLYGGGLIILFFYKMTLSSSLWRSIAIGLPLLGPLLIHRMRSRFLFTLGQLYSAGVPIDKSLEIVADTLEPGPVSEEVRQASRAATRGEALSLHIPPLLDDPLLRDAVVLGEKAGTLTEDLSRADHYYAEKADRAMHLAIQLIGWGLYCLAALVVVILVFWVWSRYLSLMP